MYSEVVTLLGDVVTRIDEYGDTIVEQEEAEVFARLDRIYFKEALQAMSQGFERQLRIRLADYYDYGDEKELIYQGKKWKIVNVQRIGTELELNCVGGVEHGKT